MPRHVRVRTVGIGAGGGDPSIFTDSFTRANGGIGTNYIVVPLGGAITSINVQEGLWGVNTNRGQLNNTTGANQTCESWLLPYVNPTKVLGQTQFMEVQWLSAVNASAFGVTAMSTPIGDQGYLLRIDPGAPNKLNLYLAGGGLTDGILISAGFDGGIPFAANDVIRVSVIPAAGSNTVKSWINGVNVATLVDSNASRPVFTGMPGLGLGQVLIAATVLFDNLRCGAGEG
jgi:hypothetical protein